MYCVLKGNQEEDHLENKHTDGRIILSFDFRSRIRWHGVNNLAQDWNKWWAAVNMVLYFQVPQNVGNFQVAEETFRSIS